jgi:hypothetical protein
MQRLGIWCCLALLLLASSVQADITTNLVLRWKLDEGGTATSLADASGNGHTGTLAASPATPTWSTGCSINASCLEFDGIDDKFTFTGLATGTTWTWAAWLYPLTGGTGEGFLFAQEGVDAIYTLNDGVDAHKIYTDGGPKSTSALPTATWTHVAVVNNAGTVTYYINGSSSGTGSSVSLTADVAGLYYKGRMAEVYFFSRALSASDVNELMAAGGGGGGGGGGGTSRLGLHVTQAELDIWRQRMTDTAHGINGYSYRDIYQGRILADADLFKNTFPTDGFWAGYTGAGCVPQDDQSISPFAGPANRFGRGNGALLMRSAFTFLLTGDTSYATPIKTELLNQITQAGTNWANTSKWCYTNLGGGNMLEIIPWLNRLMFAFDYLNAGGYTGFTATEKTNITTWFHNAATLWDNAQVFIVQSYTGYPGIYDAPQVLTCSGCPRGNTGAIYFNGPSMDIATKNTFYNQLVTSPILSMGMGLMTNDTTLVNHATAFVTAFLKAGLFDNGAFSDFDRWQDCASPCAQGMWSHAGGALSGLVAVADMYARTGNTSLYTLSGPTQVFGGSGGTVSLLTTLQLLAGMANNTIQLYGTVSGPFDESTRLTWNPVGQPDGWNGPSYWDFASMPANLFYQNSTIHTAMTRNLLGGNTTSSCADSQFGGCFNGEWASWADLPFMFGNMEGVVNPYVPRGPTSPRHLRILFMQ